MKRKNQLSNSRTTQLYYIGSRTVKYQLMTKSVLDTIRDKKAENGAPFKNMIKDHTPQKKRLQ
jgi:hypothetical protein